MKSSEWLIVQPALSKWAEWLRRHGEATMETAALIDARFFPSGAPQKAKEDSALNSLLKSADTNINPKPLCDAEATLRQYGLSREADTIVRLFDGNPDNAPRTLEYVEALLVDWEAEKQQYSGECEGGNEGDATTQSDGPFRPDGFRWKGKDYTGLRPTAWRLVEALWLKKRRTAEYRKLGKEVWDDDAIEPDKETVGTARKEANTFFQKHHVPLAVSVKGLHVSLKAVAP